MDQEILWQMTDWNRSGNGWRCQPADRHQWSPPTFSLSETFYNHKILTL